MRQLSICLVAIDSLQSALEQRLASTPYAGILEQNVERLTILQPGLDLCQRTDLFGYRLQHQRWRLAFMLQAIKGPRQARNVTHQKRFAQAVKVVTRDV